MLCTALPRALAAMGLQEAKAAVGSSCVRLDIVLPALHKNAHRRSAQSCPEHLLPAGGHAAVGSGWVKIDAVLHQHCW